MSEPLRGPSPARTDRPRPAALRVLRTLVEAHSATVAGLTERLGGHPNAVRNQLDHLVRAGFVEAVVLPRDGRGRPSRGYAATLAGRQVAGQDDHPDDQQALVEAVADHLAAAPDPQLAAAELGRAWGARLAGPGGGDPDVVGILARQGFTPATTRAGIVLQTCPLLTAARRRPEIVCGIHRGMLEAVAGRPVDLVPFGAPDGCLVTDPGVESLPHAGAPDSSR